MVSLNEGYERLVAWTDDIDQALLTQQHPAMLRLGQVVVITSKEKTSLVELKEEEEIIERRIKTPVMFRKGVL